MLDMDSSNSYILVLKCQIYSVSQLWHAHSDTCDTPSVNDDSGSSLQIRLWVQIKPLRNWRWQLSIPLNGQLGCDSKDVSLPVWMVRIVSKLPSGSIYGFIFGSGFCSLIIVSYQNCVFNSQWIGFPGFAVCDIDYFGIHDSPLIYSIFPYQGGQYFCYVLEYPHNVSITKYARLKIVDTLLMLIFMMRQGVCRSCCCP